VNSSDSVFRDNLLRGKVAFVTGGSSGIGLRIAERFAEQGAKVALVGRTQEKLDRAAAGIRQNGGDASGFAADVRDYAALSTALQKTRNLYGEIDILLCGAAGNFPAPALGMSANGFKAVIDIDLLGTFNTCRAAYEHLCKPGASIIAISATHAFRPIPLQAHVCAGKAGVDILIKTLAIEWGPAGVRANIVTPGPVDDTEGMRRLAPSQEIRARLPKRIRKAPRPLTSIEQSLRQVMREIVILAK
jgi:NAD(P)-dependent dehydrogenase (short-subunit alcohol dehydrogenase family)